MHGRASLADALFLLAHLFNLPFCEVPSLFPWWINFLGFICKLLKRDWLKQILWSLLFLCTGVICCMHIFLILCNKLVGYSVFWLVSAILFDFKTLLITFLFSCVTTAALILLSQCWAECYLSSCLYSYTWTVLTVQGCRGSRGRLHLIPIRLSNELSHYVWAALIPQLHFFWKIQDPVLRILPP